ncbi:TetR/AcrR family transcriptional regulator [Mesorhizobium tamadayense]|uniref:TetR/AcrR family transcriptional regulator n=1 Tax=Mesorhizobium tamadayense TaxID=425306 RepID=A0A3P3G7D3_9HYPH|nr:TetR/AcrR family transcriptional regulator [Mesorhizobium tamadayense]RRI05979.1 TetR/AcrR family transcriptional regulator [Mesorhizobium tamadayense]
MTSSSPSAKRQHVVDTAYALFRRDGFHATGIDRIIAEADIAKMTMYRHFPAKDELIVAVLEHRAARFERQLDRLRATADTAEAKIATILDWHERWFRDPDFHGCLFAHALAEFGDPDHPVFKAAVRQKNGLRARMCSFLEAEMPPERAEAAAAALLMLIEGATLMAQMGDVDAAVDNARKAASAIIAGARLPR